MSFQPFQPFRPFGGGVAAKDNLLQNGGFDSDLSGWLAYQTSMVWDSGRVAATGSTATGPYQVFATVPGQSYRAAVSGVITPVEYRLRIGNGSIPNAGIKESLIYTVPTDIVLDFVAQQTQSYIYLRNSGSSGTTHWDNASVRPI